MSCGSWCVYYKSRYKGNTDICKTCSDYEALSKPRFELGKVDIFKLAAGLKAREEKEKGGSSMQSTEEGLKEMGLRLEGDFTLKSGVQSRIKWDIEKMFEYPWWVRIDVLRPWIYKIGLYRPDNLVGIPKGGYFLALDIGSKSVLDIYSTDKCTTILGPSRRTVVVDDVITTGETIRGYLRAETVAIAVLINRSGLDKLDGIPILTGIFADRV